MKLSDRQKLNLGIFIVILFLISGFALIIYILIKN